MVTCVDTAQGRPYAGSIVHGASGKRTSDRHGMEKWSNNVAQTQS